MAGVSLFLIEVKLIVLRERGRGSGGTTLFQRAMTRRGSHVNYPLRRDETFRVVHGLWEKGARLC